MNSLLTNLDMHCMTALRFQCATPTGGNSNDKPMFVLESAELSTRFPDSTSKQAGQHDVYTLRVGVNHDMFCKSSLAASDVLHSLDKLCTGRVRINTAHTASSWRHHRIDITPTLVCPV